MMRQYLAAKRAHPDCLVLFRMGDFYEMFGEDARQGAALLDLVLTSRDREEPKMPMAGVPHHALDQYLGRLLKAGRRVAICDQMEDPAKAKGIVRREVTRVVTPGTVLDPGLLDDKANNYLAGVARVGDAFGVAWADVSTGEFKAAAIDGGQEEALAELLRAGPSEVIFPEGAQFTGALERRLRLDAEATLTPWRAQAFHPAIARDLLKERFKLSSLEGLGLADGSAALAAAGAVLSYIESTQMGRTGALKPPRALGASSFLEMDGVTQRNLELTANLRDGSLRGTLVALIDRTSSSMGARALRRWLTRPLTDVGAIGARLDSVAFLVLSAMLRERLRQVLRAVHDLERLTARCCAGFATPRDLASLGASLEAVLLLKAALGGGHGAGPEKPALLAGLALRLDDFPALRGRFARALTDEPPATENEGGLIREGYSAELDKLKAETKGARDWIGSLQSRERERTGLKGLKVGFNRVFGYYLEVSRGLSAAVPEDYERRQTLVNAERYVTPDLKRYEELVLSAEEQINSLEKTLFVELVEAVKGAAPALLSLAEALATLDALNGLAITAAERGYARPQVDASDVLSIRDGRHPVVEVSRVEGEFVANDTNLDGARNQIMLITGPNMAGKSTYMRQVALICLMAQMGSFVPAAEARIGVVDRILTRVGATDYVSAGQSTFMVEMVETARILNLASHRSLVLLDEVGRGTSTFDGLSIAWAVAEWLHDGPSAHPRTLFATHYHQLTDLAKDHPRVVNYHLTAREHDGGIVFVRKLLPGSTDKSYGIQVARLAGIPAPVLARAGEILARMEEQQAFDLAASSAARSEPGQAGPRAPSPVRGFTQSLLFAAAASEPALPPELLARLKAFDVSQRTPMEALALVDELKALAAGPSGPVPAEPAEATPARGPKGKPGGKL